MTASKNPGESILTKMWGRVFQKVQPSTEVGPNRSPLAVSPDTRVSQHADGLTLLHIPTGQIFVCNRTAARVWQGATEGRSVDELSEEMSRQFHIGPEIARRDTFSIVSQMELNGLIIRTGV